MKLRLEDIPEEGLSVDFELTQAKPEDLGPQVAAITSPLQAQLRLTPVNGVILARGQGGAELLLACSRCLEEFAFPVDLDLSLAFQPQPELGGDELGLKPDEMDACFIEGDEIDLGQALLDEIALELDMAPLCREDCPGLCPICGKPRSQGVCGCRDDRVDPRLAKLAQLKLPPK